MMNLQHALVLLSLLATVSICSAHIGGQSSLQDVSPQVYCGRNLARALAFLCYKEKDVVDKRSESRNMYSAILTPYYEEQESQFGWPWPPHKARSMSLPSRGKRFIVDECCDKACSINELMTYC